MWIRKVVVVEPLAAVFKFNYLSASGTAILPNGVVGQAVTVSGKWGQTKYNRPAVSVDGEAMQNQPIVGFAFSITDLLDASDVLIRYTLQPGTYTLEIAYREDGAQLDAIVITD